MRVRPTPGRSRPTSSSRSRSRSRCSSSPRASAPRAARRGPSRRRRSAPPGVTFNPPGSNPSWSGLVNSSGLAAQPIDSDLAGVDAGDLATFALVIENQGSSPHGAFDIRLRDLLAPGYVIPSTRRRAQPADPPRQRRRHRLSGPECLGSCRRRAQHAARVPVLRRRARTAAGSSCSTRAMTKACARVTIWATAPTSSS